MQKKKYQFDADMLGNIYWWDYKDPEVLIFYRDSGANRVNKNANHKELDVYTDKNELDTMDACKKVSDDINHQYQKVLSYFDKK